MMVMADPTVIVKDPPAQLAALADNNADNGAHNILEEQCSPRMKQTHNGVTEFGNDRHHIHCNNNAQDSYSSIR